MGGSIIRRILSVSLSPVSAVRARTVQSDRGSAPARSGLGPDASVASAWRAGARGPRPGSAYWRSPLRRPT